jgi:hypothetical protein
METGCTAGTEVPGDWACTMIRSDTGGSAMRSKIVRHINRTILLSIPALFEDGVCRPYKLLAQSRTAEA